MAGGGRLGDWTAITFIWKKILIVKKYVLMVCDVSGGIVVSGSMFEMGQ